MPSYSHLGPPFDFLGHMSESQKGEFYKWLDSHSGGVRDVGIWWMIRAQQLRKTAGCLEKFYAEQNDTKMTPRWSKAPWSPGPKGHFPYTFQEDLPSSEVVSQIKELFREQLQRDDEGQFQMNNVRTMIEKAEDKATFSLEGKSQLKSLKEALDRMFDLPENEAILVKDKTATFEGKPKFRVNPMDEPTPWEIASNNGLKSK